jgi:hypothetical protein
VWSTNGPRTDQMMERFGLVLVATFAAGMFCGPLL